VNPDLEDTIIKAGSWSNVQCCRSAVMRIRIQLITLIRMRILLEADPDPNIHRDADSVPDTDPTFQIKAQTLEKVLNTLNIFYTF